jgi:hypothetical protein
MTRVTGELRRQIISRAGNCCEYCLLSQADHVFPFHVEHIIAEKHRGKTSAENLCLSCPACNAHKGSDLSSVDEQTDEIVLLFNPRKHQWSDDFRLNDAIIEPLTPVGRVTVLLLHFNDSGRVEERALLIEAGRYPCHP